MGEGAIVALRPDRLIHDGSDHWRGGQVRSITGGTATIRILAEAAYVRDKSVSTSLIPAGARSVGCPVACRVTGNTPDDYVIAEIIGSSFPAGGAPRNGFYDATAFHPGIVPRSITNEPLEWWREEWV